MAEEEQEEKPRWKDYLALSIAALETVFLPLVVLIAILAFLVLLFR